MLPSWGWYKRTTSAALGHFTEMAAEAGMLSMIWAGGLDKEKPSAFPYGGRKPLLHTNPIAMAVPGDGPPSMSYDFATSATAGMKVNKAHLRGELLSSWLHRRQARHPDRRS